MNDIQSVLTKLRNTGWTVASIAQVLGVAANTVDRWHLGLRYPANSQVVKHALEQLSRRKHIPKRILKKRATPESKALVAEE